MRSPNCPSWLQRGATRIKQGEESSAIIRAVLPPVTPSAFRLQSHLEKMVDASQSALANNHRDARARLETGVCGVARSAENRIPLS